MSCNTSVEQNTHAQAGKQRTAQEPAWKLPQNICSGDLTQFSATAPMDSHGLQTRYMQTLRQGVHPCASSSYANTPQVHATAAVLGSSLEKRWEEASSVAEGPTSPILTLHHRLHSCAMHILITQSANYFLPRPSNSSSKTRISVKSC